jgi:PadR family transcriptional regulator, regulatory protein PadR
MSAELLKGHLDAMLLAVLEGGPTYGYAIAEALRERSGGAFDLAEGTIYPALHRLERSGAITSEHLTVNGRNRRMYKLSKVGRVSLRERRAGWAAFVGAVNGVLGAGAA